MLLTLITWLEAVSVGQGPSLPCDFFRFPTLGLWKEVTKSLNAAPPRACLPFLNRYPAVTLDFLCLCAVSLSVIRYKFTIKLDVCITVQGVGML